MDPTTRIAVLKSQREKEKEKENAAKEMQVRLFVINFIRNCILNII